jgi:hypothetical protein
MISEIIMNPPSRWCFSKENVENEMISRCPTTDEWVKKMWYIYTMEYTQPQRRVKFCHSQVNEWKLENFILSEVSQTHKAKNPMFCLICGI